MAISLPDISTPVVDPKTGLMAQVWFDYFKFHQKLAQLPDVSSTAPTNGQVLIYTAATGLWTPGAN
jgi:hypothetical protein